MKHVEQEFKWEANRARSFTRMLRAVKGALGPRDSMSAPVKIAITDYYLDDEQGALERQKIALRIRHSGGKFEATFKTKTELINGKAVRQEETYALSGADCFQSALKKLSAKKRGSLSLAHLAVLFVLKNKRTIRTLSLGQNTRAELAFDDCKILVAGRTLLMKEIELELKDGAEAVFGVFAQKLTTESLLPLAQISKVKTALSLRRILEGK